MKKHINNNYSSDDFCFVICAYGDSPYLEECIESLYQQSEKVRVLMVTSTPSSFIEEISRKWNLPLFINCDEAGIAGDWNYAIKVAKNAGIKLVTIAHQDDIYESDYVKEVIEKVNGFKDSLILFSDYGELRDSKKINNNRLLRIKRLLLLPIRIDRLNGFTFIKRSILAFGDAISCPTVTYVLDNLELPVFQTGFRCNLDWQAWEKLSKKSGKFTYINRILMYHRIHEESTTSGLINDVGRSGEDYEMYCKFWPSRIAKILLRGYCKAELSNKI